MEEPSQVLTEVNNIIHQDNESTMFITLIYATYDPNSGLLTYANGGHCPPLLVHPDGECVECRPTGESRSDSSPSRDYGEMSVTIPPGGTVVMYTDGVSEAMNASEEEFGTERLEEILRGSPPAGGGRDQRENSAGHPGLHRRNKAIRRHHLPDPA